VYKVTIYALTAEVDQVEIDKVLAEVCQGILAKPLNAMGLLLDLNELMPHQDSSITDGVFIQSDTFNRALDGNFDNP